MYEFGQDVRRISTLRFLGNWLSPARHVRKLTPADDNLDMMTLLSFPFIPSELDLGFDRLRGAHVCFGCGVDGVVFDRDGHAVPSTIAFVPPSTRLPDPQWIVRSAQPLEVSGFTSLDPAWRNYYHWLCLALARMRIAQEFLGSGVRMLLPTLEVGLYDCINGAACAVRRASISALDLEGQALFLAPGVYRVTELWRLCLSHEQPALLACFEHFRNAYAPVLRSLPPDPLSPRRVFIRRRYNSRIGDAHAVILRDLLSERHFMEIDLEDLTFDGQANLFHNADLIISPHGAGLSNLVFSRPQVRVLELSDFLNNENYVRPWFYYISRTFGQEYSYVNLSRMQPARTDWSSLLEAFIGE